MKKRPALGQSGFSVRPQLPVLGEPLPTRNLQSLRAGWKTKLCGTLKHFRKTCVASVVRLSHTEESFLRIIEENGPLDSEALWNQYYDYIGIECAPDVFNSTIERLLKLGLIELLEPIRPGH